MSPRRAAPGDQSDGASAVRRGTSPVVPVVPVASVVPVAPTPDRIVDPRAVRIALGPASTHAEAAPIVIEPPAVPLAPTRRIAGTGVLGGVATPIGGLLPHATVSDGIVVIDGDPAQVRLDRFGPIHGVLVEGRDEPTRTPVLLMPVDRPASASGSRAVGGPGGASAQRSPSGAIRREVVVDGWRIEVELESERRASLRERARRGREETAHGGPTEVHAIIPGVVVSVSVVPGDAVVAGQQLLVVEAMKMQNELHAPRDGVISRVAVGGGRTIEVGDLLLVLD